MENKKVFKEWTYPVRITVMCSGPEEGFERIKEMFRFEKLFPHRGGVSYTVSRAILKETEDLSPTVPKPRSETEMDYADRNKS